MSEEQRAISGHDGDVMLRDDRSRSCLEIEEEIPFAARIGGVGEEHEVMVVADEMRPEVGGLHLTSLELGDLLRCTAGRGDAKERPCRARSEDDLIVRAPRATVSIGCFAHHLCQRIPEIDALQTTVGEEADVTTIGRPERIDRADRA